jgi:hypothetical protein
LTILTIVKFPSEEMNMHANSKEAYAKLTNKERRVHSILAVLASAKKPLTDREILRRSGLGADMNLVRPRITELVMAHRLKERLSIKCPVTGRRVRTVQIA